LGGVGGIIEGLKIKGGKENELSKRIRTGSAGIEIENPGNAFRCGKVGRESQHEWPEQ
jgi:hypothetical protein